MGNGEKIDKKMLSNKKKTNKTHLLPFITQVSNVWSGAPLFSISPSPSMSNSKHLCMTV